MKKKNSKKSSSKQLIAVLAIFAISSVLFASAKENKISFRQNDFIALQEVDGQVLGLSMPETEQPIGDNGFQVEQPAVLIMDSIDLPIDPPVIDPPVINPVAQFNFQIANVGFTASTTKSIVVLMENNSEDGFILHTDRNPNTDYFVQFIDDAITPDPQLLDTPYPLYLNSVTLLPDTATSSIVPLQNYYNNRHDAGFLPEEYKTYLLNALPGSTNQKPFAYIIRDQIGTPSREKNDVHIFLADGAKKNLFPGQLPNDQSGSDMTIPGDFPLGTYYISGPEATDRISFKLTIQPNDYCADLLQGIADRIGSKVSDTRYSSIFDLNTVPDGSIDLADIGIVATYIYGDSNLNLPADNQTACYSHYKGVLRQKPIEVPTITSNNSHSNAPKLAIKPVEELPMVLGEKISNCKIDSAVAGQTEWADGSLIRGCDNKVYRIENQVKRHIVSLKDLFKYIGQRINNVSDDIVALF